MSGKWSQDMTYKFVHLYKDQECLWDTKHALYQDKTSRYAALSTIVDHMGIEGFDIEEVKIKIKSLRATYLAECAKVEKQSPKHRRNGELYKPPMPWFYIMDSFLKDNKPRQRGQKKETKRSLNDTSKSSIDDDMRDRSPLRSPSPHETILGQEKPMINITIPSMDSNGAQNQSASHCDSMMMVENEFDFFGRNVAAQLKALPLEQALDAQVLIQKILRARRLRAALNAKAKKVIPLVQQEDHLDMENAMQSSSPEQMEHTGKDPLDMKAKLEEYVQWHN